MAISSVCDISEITRRKMDDLRSILRGMGSVIVGYSGGVDSTFLAATAREELGNSALAVTAKSPSLSPSELRAAVSMAQELGLNHRIIETNEVERPDYRANNPNRCYFCKEELYTHMFRLAEEESISWISNGTNVDDLGDFRPGLSAAKSFGVRSPLVEVGLSKAEVRSLSKEMGLPTWDKPAQACLSSRIPYGMPVSIEALTRIDKAEEFLRGLGIKQLRVRHHDTLARIEVDPEDYRVLIDESIRRSIVDHFHSIGYTYVVLDMDGFRSGSLNEVLNVRRYGKDRDRA